MGRIFFGVFGEEVVGGHGVTRVVTAGGEAGGAFEFDAELREVDAQVGFEQVIFAEAGEVREFFGDVRGFGGSDVGALHQPGGEIGGGAFTGVLQERGKIGGRVGPRFVDVGGGGEAGETQDVGQIGSGAEGDGAEIQRAGDEYDAVDVNAVAGLEVIAEGGGAEGAVAFTDEKFRRIPAVVAIEIDVDELGEGFHVLIDAPEIFVLGFADGAAESGADGINEDQIGLVEEGVGVVFNFVGGGRSGRGVGIDHAARAEGTHVQPDRSGTGAAVIDESDGAGGGVFQIGASVGSGN